jgi:hypothetical protein
MTTGQQINRRRAYLFSLHFDGEPVTDPAYALRLPADFRP